LQSVNEEGEGSDDDGADDRSGGGAATADTEEDEEDAGEDINAVDYDPFVDGAVCHHPGLQVVPDSSGRECYPFSKVAPKHSPLYEPVVPKEEHIYAYTEAGVADGVVPVGRALLDADRTFLQDPGSPMVRVYDGLRNRQVRIEHISTLLHAVS
jgi:hypothetical protein